MYVEDDDAFIEPTQHKPRHKLKHTTQQQQDSDIDWLHNDEVITPWDTLIDKAYPQCTMPSQRIHMDLFGPLKTSGSGKKYIMCITDTFSKYVELVALM